MDAGKRLSDNEVLHAEPCHGLPVPVLHGDVRVHLGKFHRVHPVDTHDETRVESGDIGEKHDPALVEVHPEHVAIHGGGLLNEPLRVRARISPHRPGLALEVALKDAVPVRHKKLPGTRDGESLRILECPLPDRGERVPVQIIHEDALAGLVGDVQAVFPGDDSGGTRDARDGLHVGAVQVEADHARIAPVGDPQVPPAVKSHVLGSEEGARRASGAAEGGDLLSAGAASGDPVRPVLGDVESPVIGLHHVVGAGRAVGAGARNNQRGETRRHSRR